MSKFPLAEEKQKFMHKQEELDRQFQIEQAMSFA